MSNLIPVHRVQQYSANVYHTVQQKGSKLMGLVRHEKMRSKRQFFDAYGEVECVEKTGRHSQTPQMDTPHSRRALTMKHYHWADLIDDQDKIQMIHDPQSQYVKAAAMAFGRKKDDVIIAAISGTSYSGEEGTTAVVLPVLNGGDPETSRKIHAVSGAALSNMNTDTLRLARYYFDAVDGADGDLVMAVGAKQLYALLGEQELTSSDYNTIKTLVNGDINTFMGFTFVMINRLALQDGELKFDVATGDYKSTGTDGDGSRKCLAWIKDTVILGTGMNVETKISERDDLSYAMQVYVRMSIGGTRLEEKKVLEILCDES